MNANEAVQVVTCRGRMPDPVREPYYFYDAWLASLARYGVTPVILGEGPWLGLGDNAKRVLRAFELGRIRAKYMIFANCFDLLFAAPPEEIIDKWLATKPTDERIIFGTEKHCFSDASLAPLHPPTDSSFKYLNSGCYIGESEAIHEALEEMDPERNILDDHRLPDGSMHEDNDQVWLQRQMIASRKPERVGKPGLCGPIGLDHDCALIQNFHDVALEEIELFRDDSGKPSLRNQETGANPLIWHLNGNGKNVWKDKLLTHLGL